MFIEVSSDSETWLKLKHAIHATGQRYYFQQNLFDKNRVSLFLEDVPEPEGGELISGMIVYRGGSGISNGFSMDSKVFEVYQQETSEQPYVIHRPDAKQYSKLSVQLSRNRSKTRRVCLVINESKE